MVSARAQRVWLVVAVLVVAAVFVRAAWRTRAPLTKRDVVQATRGPAGADGGRAGAVEPPTGTGVMSGRVTLDGEGVAGARVTLLYLDDPGNLANLPDACGRGNTGSLLETACGDDDIAALVSENAGAAAVVGEVESGEDGAFRFEALGAATYAVWALAGDRVSVVDVPVGGVEKPLEVALVAGRTVSGRVMEGDSPVPGARVVAIPFVHARFLETESDEAGEFRIGPLPKERVAFVGLAGDRFPDVERVEIDGTTVELELARPGRVQGVVVQDGVPVKDAIVRAWHGGEADETRTGDDGRYGFDGLAPGGYGLEAEHGLAFGEAFVTLAGAETEDVDLALEIGAVLEVTLVPVDGVSIEEAEVAVELEATGNVVQARRSGPNVYVARGLVAGKYLVDVAGPGLAPAWTSVQLVTGRRDSLRIEVDREAWVRGMVVDERGVGVAGAFVAVAPDPVRGRHRGDSTTSREDGTFTLEGLPRGPVTLLATADDLLPMQPSVEAIAPAEGVRIGFTSGLAVEWTVREASGAPANDVLVTTTQEEPPPPGSRRMKSDTRRRCVTDTSGRCRTRGHVAGPLVAKASLPVHLPDVPDAPPGSAADLGTRRDVTLSGSGPFAFELVLGKSGRIAGTVVDQDGAPVSHVLVRLVRGDDSVEVFSDAAGAFAIERLPVGRKYTVHVFEPEGYAQASGTEASAGDERLRLVLEKLARIHGRVVDASKRPITAARVNDVPVAADGTFTLERGMSGNVQAVVNAPGYSTEFLSRPKAGSGGDFGDVVLSAIAVVSGVVVEKSSGAPIAGATLTLRPTGGAGRSRADGTFSLEAPLDPKAVLEVRTLRHATRTLPLTGPVEGLRIELARGGQLSVAFETPGDYVVLGTDAHGNREIGNGAAPILLSRLEPGPWALRGAIDGGEVISFLFEGTAIVREGETTTVLLTRPAGGRRVVLRVAGDHPYEAHALARGRHDLAEGLAAIRDRAAFLVSEHGGTTFDDVPPDTYTALSCDDDRCWGAPVVVPPGTGVLTLDVAYSGPGVPAEF